MRRTKSYSSIWNVEKVLYSIGDVNLPFAVTWNQIGWFTVTFLLLLNFGHLIPIPFLGNPLIKYLAIPCCVSKFMGAKTFDGKKPYNFIRTVIMYFLRPHTTYGGKALKRTQEIYNEEITIVSSVSGEKSALQNSKKGDADVSD